MQKQEQGQEQDKWVTGYRRMLKRVEQALDSEILHKAIAKAHKTAIELGELTQEEADKIATYLKRDFHDASHYMQETGHALSDWLKFDWMMIEAQLWDLMSSVADKTKLQWLALEREWHEYKTGEVTAAGSLQCSQCHHVIRFKDISIIPECPECQHKAFTRVRH